MKRILLLLLLLLPALQGAHAQDVYNYVLENATRVVNNPMSNFTNTRIAQFKRTALVYLKSKAFEQTDSVPVQFLNTQAYYLSEFLTLFFDQILKDKSSTAAVRRERIQIFMKASLNNPLFGDTDYDTVHSYVNDSGEFTPFSLDTDWEKAYAEAKAQLK